MRLRPPTPTDGDGVAVNRERFLTAEALEPAEVRDTILASWSRSRELNSQKRDVSPAWVCIFSPPRSVALQISDTYAAFELE